MNSYKSLRGYLFILGGTVFWGMSAVIAKVLFNHTSSSPSEHVDPLILAQMRVTFSCLVMVLLFALFNRQALRVRPADLYRLALLGVIGIAGSNFTYYFTIQQTSVSTAILIQYTAPLLVVAYVAVTKEETLNGFKIAAALLSLAGCFLAVGGKEFTLRHLSGLGLLSGVGSAVCWAFANIYLRRLLKQYSVWTVLVFSFLAASLFWLFFNPPWVIAAKRYSSDIWFQFFGFALISVLIPHSLYFTGVRYLTASRAIITGTFEPIVAIAGSFVVLGDVLTPIQMVGAAAVIGAIALLQMKREEGEMLAVNPSREIQSR